MSANIQRTVQHSVSTTDYPVDDCIILELVDLQIYDAFITIVYV